MATDDERREAAERLRAKLAEGSPHSIYESVCYALGKTEHEGNWDVIARLADLVEPSCDREVLLALADEMDKWALTCDHYDRQVSPLDVTKYARRIREACGEVVG